MEAKGIVATEADVGRRVRIRHGPTASRFGRLASHRGCPCGRPCCLVEWEDMKGRVPTWQRYLDWADEDQLL